MTAIESAAQSSCVVTALTPPDDEPALHPGATPRLHSEFARDSRPFVRWHCRNRHLSSSSFGRDLPTGRARRRVEQGTHLFHLDFACPAVEITLVMMLPSRVHASRLFEARCSETIFPATVSACNLPRDNEPDCQVAKVPPPCHHDRVPSRRSGGLAAACATMVIRPTSCRRSYLGDPVREVV